MNPPEQVKIYALLFLLAFALVLVLIPSTIRLAERIKALDFPEERKVHGAPVPRLGGLAVFTAIWLSLLVGFCINRYIRVELPSAAGLILGSIVILFLGVYDDVRNASPFTKIIVQLLAAGIAVSLGIRFHLASNPLAEGMRNYFDLGALAVPLTILWIIGLTNAINLIDGLDGLATGIALFTSVALFLISLKQGAGVVTYFYASTAGATLAFLKFNRYPAQVFLGDNGATFLGFLLACLSILGSQKSYTVTALFIPLIVFGIPIFDSITALVRRYLARAKIEQADSQHIHHQLLHAGLTQRQAVWILYALTIILGIIGFSFTVLLDEYAAVIVIVIGLLGGFVAKELNVFGRERRLMERGFRYAERHELEQAGQQGEEKPKEPNMEKPYRVRR